MACSSRSAPLQSAPEETVASEPILGRLSEPELQTVEAADLYNASDYRRTIGGVSKSLGEPRASILPLAGVNQSPDHDRLGHHLVPAYRVSPESAQPVKLEARGHELGDSDGAFQAWNARIQPDGRIVLQIARL